MSHGRSATSGLRYRSDLRPRAQVNPENGAASWENSRSHERKGISRARKSAHAPTRARRRDIPSPVAGARDETPRADPGVGRHRALTSRAACSRSGGVASAAPHRSPRRSSRPSKPRAEATILPVVFLPRCTRLLAERTSSCRFVCIAQPPSTGAYPECGFDNRGVPGRVRPSNHQDTPSLTSRPPADAESVQSTSSSSRSMLENSASIDFSCASSPCDSGPLNHLRALSSQ